MAARLGSSKHLSSFLFSPKVTAPFPSYFSTHIVGESPVLVRDFIHAALYDPEHGYFSQRPGSVGVLDRSIKFHQLEGRRAYMKHLNTIYKQSDLSWYTPVELFKCNVNRPFVCTHISDKIQRIRSKIINLLRTVDILQSRQPYLFPLLPHCSLLSSNAMKKYEFGIKAKPWYAHGIAEAIMRTADLSVPLKIYEIGGGSGTCARGVMDYIKLNAPTRVYDNMKYVSVEISSSLANKQLQTVGEVDSHLTKFSVECRDAADPNGWGIEQQSCWVVLLEVLDNLPHDLIYSKNQVSPWMEVWVEKQDERSGLRELYKPLEDPLIESFMEILELEKDGSTHGIGSSVAKSIWAKVFPKPRRCWLPTGCLKLLQALHGAMPKMSLIASDFSYLPDVRVPGERAPLVASKKDGNSSDHNSYLDANGDADIFFPTDFWLLERIDHYCSGWMKTHENSSSKKGKKRRTLTLDTSSFMEEFGLPFKTRTKDGYNPMLDDFKNTKFYLSVPTHNIK